MAENSTQQERPATEQAPNQAQPTNGQANNQGQQQAPGSDGQNPQSQSGQGQPGQPQQDQSEEPKKKKKPTIYIVAGVLLILGIIFGGRAYVFNLSHVSTDDAYITGNSVNVSALISGTLNKLTVQEGDAVKNGELIGRIEASGQEASLRAAQAAYQSAQTEIPQAQTTLKYQEQASQAALQKAEAANAAQSARTRGAGDQLALTRRTTASTIAQANAQVTQAKAQAAQVAASGLTAAAQVRVAQQAVTTAQRGVDQLQAKVLAAQAEVKRTQADLQRYSRLLAQEAVTQQNYDSIASQAATAQSNLDSLEQQISQARSQVISAQQTVSQNQANYAAALQSAQAANEQIKVAEAGLAIAKANRFQVGVQNSNVQTSAATNGSSQADIQTAKAGLTQVDVQRQHIATVQAQAQQAKAAVDNAKVELNDTYIYSPADGQVVRKSVNVGASLSPGQTIVTITQGHQTWVTANFKETQLTDVRVGQPAEIEVDSFPGITFRAVVASVNDATGATTSLLPPDNSTGNFTKVVQRIPVRLAFVQGEAKGDASADDLKLLRQGMSVTATIDTADKTPHPDRVPKDYNRPSDERTAFRSSSDVQNPGTPASVSGLPMDRPADRKRYEKVLVG